MIYTPELIKLKAPSIFAVNPSPKMTKKYNFVPTSEVLEFFNLEGWEISSVKQTGKGIHSLHEVRFRNSELPKVGDTVVEAIVRNSHNGSASFSMGAGLFRLICSNGLTVPTSTAEKFTMRHNHFKFDDVKMLAESFSKKLPIIERSVLRMMNREMTDYEKIDFVRKSAKIRFDLNKTFNDLEILNLLTPNRSEDAKNDLWSVFNVVQEKFIRGGVKVLNNKGKSRKIKKINNIISENRINTKLWELAEETI